MVWLNASKHIIEVRFRPLKALNYQLVRGFSFKKVQRRVQQIEGNSLFPSLTPYISIKQYEGNQKCKKS